MGNLINWVFLTLSEAVFKAVSGIYSLFYGLATARLFRADTIQNVSNRIYVLVSVVILFAFSVKLIEAIVNPDLLTDAKKGVTGVLKRTIIGLLLIVAIPNIFNFVYYLQAEIIVGGLVEKVVLGYTDSDSESGVEGAGGELTSTIITSFVIPIDINGVPFTESGLCNGDVNCNYGQALINANEAYEDYVSFLGGNPNYDKLNEIKGDIVWEKGKPIYDINGLALLAVGCFILYQIIILCLDAGLRLVELGLLEVIAPVVIVSYIAAGTDHLSKWTKMTVEKFTSILIRIAGLCFMVLGFRLMNDKNSIFNNDSVSFWFKVFLIIGLLRMVKEIPDIFGALFGAKIKMGGIKDKLGEMAGIGKMAQNAWSGLGGIAKASPQLLAAAGRGIGRGFRKIDDKLGERGLGHKIGKLRDSAADKINSNEKLSKVRNIAGKVGGVAKGAASYAGRAGKVVGAAYKSQGKDAKGAVNKALDENFKAERFEDKQMQEKKAKARIVAKIEAASGGAIKLKSDGKIDYGKTVEANKSREKISDLNKNLAQSVGGLTQMQREALAKLNDERSKFSEAKDKMDRYNDLSNILDRMYNASDNQEQKGAITRAKNLLEAGQISNMDDMRNCLTEIGKHTGEGAIDASTFGQMKNMAEKATQNAENSHVFDEHKGQKELQNDVTAAEKDYNDQTKKVEGMEVNDSEKALYKAVTDTINNNFTELEKQQNKAAYDNINSSINMTQMNNSTQQSTQQSTSQTTPDSGTASQGASAGAAQGGAAQGGPAPAGNGNGNGGTVQANIDTSGIEKKLDDINNSVQEGSKNITDQVRTSGETINSSVKTGTNILNDIKTDVNKSRETIENIEKHTKDLNDKIE